MALSHPRARSRRSKLLSAGHDVQPIGISKTVKRAAQSATITGITLNIFIDVLQTRDQSKPGFKGPMKTALFLSLNGNKFDS